MFGMSVVDTLSSSAMAFSTLPMPKYMPFEKEFGYRWSGIRLGNTTTCVIQGFFLTFGSAAMFSYNTMLVMYYCCAIAFMMRECNIRRYAEPFFHGLPIVLGTFSSTWPLFRDTYNPSTELSWCGVLNYPHECSYQPSCLVRGRVNAHSGARQAMGIWVSVIFILVILSFGLIIYRAVKIDQQLSKALPSSLEDTSDRPSEVLGDVLSLSNNSSSYPSYPSNPNSCHPSNKGEDHTPSSQVSTEDRQSSDLQDSNGNANANANENINNDDGEDGMPSDLEKVRDKRQHTKIIIKQALGYFCAFLLTLFFPILRNGDFNLQTEVLLAKLTLFFYPLQGLLNFIIFCAHKIHNYRITYKDKSRSEVFRMLFMGGFNEPLYISRITIIERELPYASEDEEESHEDDSTPKEKPKILVMQVRNEADIVEDFVLSRDILRRKSSVIKPTGEGNSQPSSDISLAYQSSAGRDVLVNYENNDEMSDGKTTAGDALGVEVLSTDMSYEPSAEPSVHSRGDNMSIFGSIMKSAQSVSGTMSFASKDYASNNEDFR